MNNTMLPVPLKSQMVRYGQFGRPNACTFTNKASNQMRDALDSVEESLNNLGDALKNRFRELLVSQLSLLRCKDNKKDIHALPSSETNDLSNGKFVSEEPNFVKRCNLKSVHFHDLKKENLEKNVVFTNVARKLNAHIDKNLLNQEDLSPREDDICSSEIGLKLAQNAVRYSPKVPARVSLDLSPKEADIKDDTSSSESDTLLSCPQNRNNSVRGSRKSPVRVNLESQMKTKYGENVIQSDIVNSVKPVTGNRRRCPVRTRGATPKAECSTCPSRLGGAIDTQGSPYEPEKSRPSNCIRTIREDINPKSLIRPPEEQQYEHCCDPGRNIKYKPERIKHHKSSSDINTSLLADKSSPKVEEYLGTNPNHSLHQIQKKQLLNSITTLVCATNEAVKKMANEEFDRDIWKAIHKNASAVEADVEKLNKSLTTGDILAPQAALKEAEGQLKTRLEVLFNLNKGRNGFLASNASKQDIMENILLLKSSSYRLGAVSQNELLFSEMRQILKEMKNLSDCFQNFGARLTMGLKDNSEDRNNFNISFADNDNYSDTFSRQAETSNWSEPTSFLEEEDGFPVKKSSSLETLTRWCSSLFDRLSDVQKAITILLLAAFVVYVITEILSGACSRIRAIADMWNNLTILHFGPPVV